MTDPVVVLVQQADADEDSLDPELLTDNPVQAVVAHSDSECFEMLERFRPHCVVLSLTHPVADPIRMIRQIRLQVLPSNLPSPTRSYPTGLN